MLPSREQWRRWTLPSKYSFAGFVIGLLGLIVSLWATWPEKKIAPLTPQKFAMQQAQDELLKNLDCIKDLRVQLERDIDWPICHQSHIKIDELFQNHFFFIGENSYGEDNTLIDTWKGVTSAIDKRNAAKDVDEFKRVEIADTVTLRDMYFHQAFLIWYLDPRINDSKAQLDKNSPEGITHISDKLWNKWPAKLTKIDGERVDSFTDWLGYLD